MESTTEIANMALSHLGIGKEISNLDDEKSQEARACRRFFNSVRDVVLRDFDWAFASKIVALALIEEDPNSEWAYSYRLPSDCIAPRRILSGTRTDTNSSEIAYLRGQDDDGQLIYTDEPEAYLEYTKRETRVQFYPSDFGIAMSLRLAAYIAPQLTGGDPFKVGARAMQFYTSYEIPKAQANSLNEQRPDQPPDAESIRARN